MAFQLQLSMVMTVSRFQFHLNMKFAHIVYMIGTIIVSISSAAHSSEAKYLPHREIKAAPKNDFPTEYLMDPAAFREQFTNNGLLYHGTDTHESTRDILENGFIPSDIQIQIYSHNREAGWGVFASVDSSWPLGHAINSSLGFGKRLGNTTYTRDQYGEFIKWTITVERDGDIIPLLVSENPHLRIAYKKVSQSAWFKEKFSQFHYRGLGSHILVGYNEVYKALAQDYGIDIIVADKAIVILNAAAITVPHNLNELLKSYLAEYNDRSKDIISRFAYFDRYLSIKDFFKKNNLTVESGLPDLTISQVIDELIDIIKSPTETDEKRNKAIDLLGWEAELGFSQDPRTTALIIELLGSSKKDTLNSTLYRISHSSLVFSDSEVEAILRIIWKLGGVYNNETHNVKQKFFKSHYSIIEKILANPPISNSRYYEGYELDSFVRTFSYDIISKYWDKIESWSASENKNLRQVAAIILKDNHALSNLHKIEEAKKLIQQLTDMNLRDEQEKAKPKRSLPSPKKKWWSFLFKEKINSCESIFK